MISVNNESRTGLSLELLTGMYIFGLTPNPYKYPLPGMSLIETEVIVTVPEVNEAVPFSVMGMVISPMIGDLQLTTTSVEALATPMVFAANGPIRFSGDSESISQITLFPDSLLFNNERLFKAILFHTGLPGDRLFHI